MNKGLVHIYTGTGKGKTTAAMGMCIRALGNNMRVKVYQFCKGTPSGERKFFEGMENIEFHRAKINTSKFMWDMNVQEKAEYAEVNRDLFEDACEAASDDSCDLVVLDEIMAAINHNIINIESLLYLVSHKSVGTELVLTGRDAPNQLIKEADYVSEISNIKHPMDLGIHSRRGIEF